MADLNVASRAETTVLMDASARYGRLLQDPSLEIELARIVDQGRQRGEIRAGIDCDQVGQLLAACYFSTILRWIREEPAPFDLHQRLVAAVAVTAVTWALRALPFAALAPLRASATVQYLSTRMPADIMLILVAYCLRDLTLTQSRALAPLAALAVTVGLRLWRRNALLSILGGTTVHVILASTVFAR